MHSPTRCIHTVFILFATLISIVQVFAVPVRLNPDHNPALTEAQGVFVTGNNKSLPRYSSHILPAFQGILLDLSTIATVLEDVITKVNALVGTADAHYSDCGGVTSPGDKDSNSCFVLKLGSSYNDCAQRENPPGDRTPVQRQREARMMLEAWSL